MCDEVEDDDDVGKFGRTVDDDVVLSWTNSRRLGSVKTATACSTALHLSATYNSDLNGSANQQ